MSVLRSGFSARGGDFIAPRLEEESEKEFVLRKESALIGFAKLVSSSGMNLETVDDSMPFIEKYRISREDDPACLCFYVLDFGQGVLTDDEKSFYRFYDSMDTETILNQLKGNGRSCLATARHLRNVLDGGDFERIISSENSEIGALDDAFWNNWKEIGCDGASVAYYGKIYPSCVGAIKGLLKPSSTVVEICGGDGDFAFNLLSSVGERVQRYHLIDRNEASLFKARDTLSARIEDGTVRVEKADILEKFLEDVPEASIDLAIGIGALTSNVLSTKAEALIALGRLTQLIRPGGAIILSGYTASFIGREDLERAGFDVSNSNVPGKGIHLYIAKKRERAFEEEAPPETSLERSPNIIDNHF